MTGHVTLIAEARKRRTCGHLLSSPATGTRPSRPRRDKPAAAAAAAHVSTCQLTQCIPRWPTGSPSYTPISAPWVCPTAMDVPTFELLDLSRQPETDTNWSSINPVSKSQTRKVHLFFDVAIFRYGLDGGKKTLRTRVTIRKKKEEKQKKKTRALHRFDFVYHNSILKPEFNEIDQRNR